MPTRIELAAGLLVKRSRGQTIGRKDWDPNLWPATDKAQIRHCRRMCAPWTSPTDEHRYWLKIARRDKAKRKAARRERRLMTRLRPLIDRMVKAQSRVDSARMTLNLELLAAHGQGPSADLARGMVKIRDEGTVVYLDMPGGPVSEAQAAFKEARERATEQIMSALCRSMVEPVESPSASMGQTLADLARQGVMVDAGLSSRETYETTLEKLRAQPPPEDWPMLEDALRRARKD